MRWGLLFLTTLFLGAADARAAEEPLRVVASFSLLADMAQEIGGDAVHVASLVGPDGDAHAYQPTPADLKAVGNADLLIINGLAFEGWLDRLIRASGYKGKLTIASRGIKPLYFDKTTVDPHAWQDLRNGQIYARNIAGALMDARPGEAEAIRQRARDYIAAMAALDGEIRAELASFPEAKRKIITSHDAFGYFGAAYGISFRAPVGLSTEAEPSAADVAKLVKQIKAEKIRVVFMENMSNPKLVEQLARDGGARLGGSLYPDALSAPNGPAPTYLKMIRFNTDMLKTAMENQ
ncbi:MAG: metal ABC transporter substrate-binding protein [Alphaproteobacteria bacterium]|nr:metal ABC transporter substrate-binding protein [Alphaproteobacteria bacterium]